MSEVSINIAVEPVDFHRYMDVLDETELPYHFVLTSEKAANLMVLELQLDGTEHNGMRVHLSRDGTWSVTTRIVVR